MDQVQYCREMAAWCRGWVRDDYRPPAVALDRTFEGAGGIRLLMGLPGFGDLWDREVPAVALHGGSGAVACTCGAGTELRAGVVECSGCCGRYFLVLADAVLVHRFER